jgi:hypothetical protein
MPDKDKVDTTKVRVTKAKIGAIKKTDSSNTLEKARILHKEQPKGPSRRGR